MSAHRQDIIHQLNSVRNHLLSPLGGESRNVRQFSGIDITQLRSAVDAAITEIGATSSPPPYSQRVVVVHLHVEHGDSAINLTADISEHQEVRLTFSRDAFLRLITEAKSPYGVNATLWLGG